MGISTRTEYATRALLDLALAREGTVVKTADVAERQRIPKKYLEQILLVFKREGMVRSKPGLHGGYMLARPARQITMAEVVRAVDGPLAPVRCVSLTAYAPCTCPHEEVCPLRAVWQEARRAMAEVLERTSLADVADRAREIGYLKAIG
ncbi:MAG TPA: Rrf2 family transcriptional regulator [bacterium]|jgi:Rrf2 family protein|nr:Rrf2 family transcriptional regulator [bacterium]